MPSSAPSVPTPDWASALPPERKGALRAWFGFLAPTAPDASPLVPSFQTPAGRAAALAPLLPVREALRARFRAQGASAPFEDLLAPVAEPATSRTLPAHPHLPPWPLPAAVLAAVVENDATAVAQATALLPSTGPHRLRLAHWRAAVVTAVRFQSLAAAATLCAVAARHLGGDCLQRPFSATAARVINDRTTLVALARGAHPGLLDALAPLVNRSTLDSFHWSQRLMSIARRGECHCDVLYHAARQALLRSAGADGGAVIARALAQCTDAQVARLAPLLNERGARAARTGSTDTALFPAQFVDHTTTLQTMGLFSAADWGRLQRRLAAHPKWDALWRSTPVPRPKTLLRLAAAPAPTAAPQVLAWWAHDARSTTALSDAPGTILETLVVMRAPVLATLLADPCTGAWGLRDRVLHLAAVLPPLPARWSTDPLALLAATPHHDWTAGTAANADAAVAALSLLKSAAATIAPGPDDLPIRQLAAWHAQVGDELLAWTGSPPTDRAPLHSALTEGERAALDRRRLNAVAVAPSTRRTAPRRM